MSKVDFTVIEVTLKDGTIETLTGTRGEVLKAIEVLGDDLVSSNILYDNKLDYEPTEKVDTHPYLTVEPKRVIIDIQQMPQDHTLMLINEQFMQPLETVGAPPEPPRKMIPANAKQIDPEVRDILKTLLEQSQPPNIFKRIWIKIKGFFNGFNK